MIHMPHPFRFRIIDRLLLAGLTGLFLAAPGQAQEAPTSTEQPLAEVVVDMETANAAWQRGDFALVRQVLAQLAADPGAPLAQYRYGLVLLEGRGGPRDPQAAATWLQKAVDQDHLAASTLLARLYLSGPSAGVPRDPARAAALLAGAAARGDKEAQYYLGLLTRNGDGVPKDETAALNWFLAAAEQQHVEAQYALSQAYSEGQGTPKNTAKALKWLQEAASSGHRDAQFFLALALESGQGVVQNIPQALSWYRRAAEQGHPLSQRLLGTRYLQGDGVEQNLDEALRWLTPAAEAGDPGAMANLGYAYASGTGGGGIDDDAALHWYGRAAEAGVGRAMLVLGTFHETGRGVAVDPARAAALYQQAAAEQTPGAVEQLGHMALAGTFPGAPQDAVPWVAALAKQDVEGAEAWLESHAGAGMRNAQVALGLLRIDQGDAPDAGADLLARAAEAGDTRAQLELGKLYATGNGVALDYVAAHKWLNIAAAQGSSAATEQRDVISNLMTPEQIADAQTAARTFFETARNTPPVTAQGDQ